jgi:hypothetical protein
MTTLSSDLSRILHADEPKEIAKTKKKKRFTMQFTAKQPPYVLSSSKKGEDGSMLNPLA